MSDLPHLPPSSLSGRTGQTDGGTARARGQGHCDRFAVIEAKVMKERISAMPRTEDRAHTGNVRFVPVRAIKGTTAPVVTDLRT